MVSLGLASAFPAWAAPEAEAPIQDNSVLIEEAYNQEEGVVQHINNFGWVHGTGEWAYSLTEEWPVFSQTHQLGATLPFQSSTEPSPDVAGMGDLAVNYRYQLIGDGDARVAVSPRVSLVVPTGSVPQCLGSGKFALETNVPASFVLLPWLVAHLNAGVGQIEIDRRQSPPRVFGGLSLALLVTQSLNVMVEALAASAWDPEAGRRSWELRAGPVVRRAFDLDSGLQVVPAAGVYAVVAEGEETVFSPSLYLSFEHPLLEGTRAEGR